MRSARDVANWFLAWAQESQNAGISNLKMQKLLYYAQGHYLAATGSPLFGARFQAWTHGPVVPEVYRQFRDYGSADIDADAEVPDDFDWDEYKDIEDHLVKVWNTYGPLDAWALRNQTHQEAPWHDAFDRNRKNVEIPDESIREYFASI